MFISIKKANYWLIGIILLGIFVYLINDVLLPFVVGIFVAYFFDPAADKLEKHGFTRQGATVAILAIFFATLLIISVLIIPIIADQLLVLATKIPVYTSMLNDRLEPRISDIMSSLDSEAIARMQSVVGDMSGYFFGMFGKLLANIWQSWVAILSLISLILISPVVAFYLLRDWDLIVEKIDSWLPREHVATIRRLANESDRAIAGFVRGQATVMLILGIFYSIGLEIVGLDSALVVGLGTGLLTIIPYVGIMFGMAIGITMAFLQFGGAWMPILFVAGIFILGQFMEGNFITPKLVGDRVGLHPVWIIFGMLAGGALFGFVGILLAIPVTAVIGVLVRFAISEYLKSDAYYGNKKKKDKKK